MLSERNISDVKANWPEHWHIYAEAPNRYFEAQLSDAALSQLLSRLGMSRALLRIGERRRLLESV
jgi:hypothetical protein